MNAAAKLAPIVALVLLGCGLDPYQTDHGGVAADVSASLGEPAPFATADQLAAFERGRQWALRRFEYREGLGPAFNASSCAGCHQRPAVGGGAALHRNVFVGGVNLPAGGFLPLESSGPSGGIVRQYAGPSGDERLAHPALAADVDVIAQRNPVALFGVGLLAEISETEIVSRADPDDADGDSISGRANYQRGTVARFGRKAQGISLQLFVRDALFVHAGLTSDPLSEADSARLPIVERTARQTALRDDDGVDDPELSAAQLFDLMSFSMLLAAPAVELQLGEQAVRGRTRFDQLACGGCHTPRVSGPRGPLPLYSDLLLHDMGEELADGIVQGQASGSEFRTQPLWGLGGVGPYLHDGRASTFEQAILWHGGEAQIARDAYAALDRVARDELLAFLRSLGGGEQRSAGSIPAGSAVPAVAALGGPLRTLSEDELARFSAGRALFDRDFSFSDGIGTPQFEGNSCRGCHFDPVMGGAGSRGVSIIRQGIVSNTFRFSAPEMGTLLPRLTHFEAGISRPDDETNLFELRQPPALFGLGLIDAVSNEAILANADPDDSITPDGISGRAEHFETGPGRYGYKGQQATLEQVIRDSVAGKLGLTSDEIRDDDVALFVDYLRMLAPPPRGVAADPTLVAEGEALFGSLGCAGCHLPSLPAPDGPVPLYSDLLLHEISNVDALGIEAGSVQMREFRTTPLWGVRLSAPYLHDGRADSLHQAIIAHDGEGAAARDAYGGLPQSVRAALIAFLETL